jgi:ABC-type spermidine/putrescine transport system permease subunit II
MRGSSVQSLAMSSPRGRLAVLLWAAYGVGIYVFLYAPLLCLAVLSFNDTMNITLPWRGFTLRWYGEALHDRDLHTALLNSFKLGIATVVIATPIGVAAAYAFRRHFRLRELLFNLILVALIAPPIIVGVAQHLTWNILGVNSSLFGSTLLGHVSYTAPFIFVLIFPSFHRFDASIEEAALDLGATRLQMFRTVIMPIVMPGIVSSAVFAFMLSFDEFIRTFFLIGVDNTLPIYLWSMLMTNVSPETNAIATLLMVFSLCLMTIGYRLTRQNYRVK